VTHIWPEPQSVSQLFQPETADWKQALITLLVAWTFAAFGEEMSYRGYLLTRAADLGGRSSTAWWLAMIVVAILFGFGHYYKGPAGVADSTYSGLVLGSAYLLSGRNLWTAILAHGISDTVAVVLVFTGLAS
jgi:membrane protease YdiL (CAAX protease family)